MPAVTGGRVWKFHTGNPRQNSPLNPDVFTTAESRSWPQGEVVNGDSRAVVSAV